MNVKLAHKLFLSYALIIVVLVSAFLAFSYVSNQSLLSNAMNGIDEKVIEELIPILSQRFERQGSFAELIADPAQWNALVDANFFRVFIALSPKIPQVTPNIEQPPTAAPHLQPCEPPFPTFLQRLSLLGQDKNTLIAAPKPKSDTYQQPIKHHGRIIGWLSVGKINVDTLPLAGYFFDQQLQLTIWATSCAGLFAIVLGFLFSRHITQPILLITREAQKLAKRDFNVNIQVDTRDEVQALAMHINAIASELKQFSLQQQQWLLDISHELRTPLTILYGEVTAILDNVSEVNMDTIHSLQEEVVHLKRLVDDLHSLTMVDSAEFRLSLSRLNLCELVQFHTARYCDRFEKMAIELYVSCADDNLIINGDKDRIGQVLRNILENNLRYTQSPGAIWVTLGREANGAKISVADTGPGVAEVLMEKLFDRLFRVDASRSRVSGGAGLGLAICKTIVEAHKGTISAVASVQGGLNIIIVLPLDTSVES